MGAQVKAKKFMQADLLHGPIFRSMVLFALPILVSELFQQMYNTMDTVIVGHTLGEGALAAMGACAPLFELLVGFALGVGNGLALVAARSFGAGDQERLKKTVASSLAIGAGITVMMMAVARTALYPLLQLLHTPEEIIGDAYRYISLVTQFVGVMFAYNLLSGLLRAIGDSVMPLVFLMVSSVLNIGLDYLLIRTFGMGVEGAAAATVLSQGLSVVLCLLYMLRGKRLLLPEKEHFRPDGGLYRELLSQGLSVGFMNSIVSIGSVTLQSGINSLGCLTIAGHEAARKIMFFCMMPVNAISNAASVLVSQNKGADQVNRIRRAMKETYLAGAAIAAVCFLLMIAAAPQLVRLISGSDAPVVLQNGARYLRVCMPFFVFLCMVISTQYSLQGIGQKVLPLVASAIELTGKIFFALFLVPRFGYSAVIICEPLLWTVMAVWLVWAFFGDPYIRAGMGKNHGIVHDTEEKNEKL